MSLQLGQGLSDTLLHGGKHIYLIYPNKLETISNASEAWIKDMRAPA